MTDFADTRLHRLALTDDGDGHNSDAWQRLQVALAGFRRRATRLASVIASDLPGFTGHDVEHLDALWATADVIVGEDWTFNPLEAFVFGAAVLLHDLALSTAAYLGGSASVEQGEDFADALRLALSAELGREPTTEELVDPAPRTRSAAREAVLRARHAERTSELATEPLMCPAGELSLLEDSELRDELADRPDRRQPRLGPP